MRSKIIRIGGILYIINASIYLLFEFLTAYATRSRFKVYIYISLYKCTSDYMLAFTKFQ